MPCAEDDCDKNVFRSGRCADCFGAHLERVTGEMDEVNARILDEGELEADEEKLETTKATFLDFDEDGSGDIDVNELGRAMERLGRPMNFLALRKMVKAVDTDHSGTVSYEEFLRMFLAKRERSELARTLETKEEDEDEALARIAQLEAEVELLRLANAGLADVAAEQDADLVYAAARGWGTDDALLVDTLCTKTKAELAGVAAVFQEKYDRTLEDLIKSECSGDYEDFLVNVVSSKAEVDAETAFKAMDGFGTNEDKLIEVLCTRSAEDIAAMRDMYHKRHGRLIDRLRSELSGDLEGLLVWQVVQSTEKDESAEADEEAAAEQVEALYKAGPGKRFGTDEQAIYNVLCSLSQPQMALVVRMYEDVKGKSLERMIKSEFSGNAEKALLVLIQPRVWWLAGRLREAMEGLGTDEAKLVRALGWLDRAEIPAVAEAYTERFDRSLQDDLDGELGGGLKRAVMAYVSV